MPYELFFDGRSQGHVSTAEEVDVALDRIVVPTEVRLEDVTGFTVTFDADAAQFEQWNDGIQH